MLSVLLFSVVITRLHALLVTLRAVGKLTLAAVPLPAAGVASNGVVVFTPEKASITPDQLLVAELAQEYVAGAFDAILYQTPWFRDGDTATAQPTGATSVPGQSVTVAMSRSPF